MLFHQLILEIQIKELLFQQHVNISSQFIPYCNFRFLTMLEEEVYGTNSPIWDADFQQSCPNLPQVLLNTPG